MISCVDIEKKNKKIRYAVGKKKRGKKIQGKHEIVLREAQCVIHKHINKFPESSKTFLCERLLSVLILLYKFASPFPTFSFEIAT